MPGLRLEAEMHGAQFMGAAQVPGRLVDVGRYPGLLQGPGLVSGEIYEVDDAHLARLDSSGLDPRLLDVQVEVAADVDNPLCGANGASAIFGPQKGASPAQVALLDHALGHFADHCAGLLEEDVRAFPGCGAAGGMGFAAKAFMGAQFRAGVEVVAELAGLEAAVRGADLVITGEGRFDAQTLRGKTPFGVARIARRHGVPVVVIAGTLGEGYQALYEHGIDAAFALTQSVT